jgi:hypothetical protein
MQYSESGWLVASVRSVRIVKAALDLAKRLASTQIDPNIEHSLNVSCNAADALTGLILVLSETSTGFLSSVARMHAPAGRAAKPV